ncbi:MAG: signal peptide peptidase SppA, partial [Deltaproteobacteria bacterium]
LVNGFAATALFAAAGLDKLGVKAEFFRVGAYKNAPDLFTRTGMSGEQREVESSLLDDLYGRYVKRISDTRHLDESKVKSLLDEGILKPGEAVQAGLIDGLVYPDQLEEEAGKVLGAKVILNKVGTEEPALRELRWGGRPRIAVVRVVGDIVRGEGGRDPFGVVRLAGSDGIIGRIRHAADDPAVSAIVVRVDSPGGDGTASDLIWRELVRARKEKKKPVIASMGDVAASGGYYVAAGADVIFAEPATITGSIGVFIGHFDASVLLGKLGLNLMTLKRGASADLFNPDRSLSEAERKTLQAWVEAFYADFVSRVAQSRGLTEAEVHRVAQGRVWTGAQALEHKLVDRLGGLEDALAEAKRRSGFAADEAVELDDEEPISVDLTSFASATALDALPLGLAPRGLRALALLGEPGTLRAALPCDLEVQ